MCAATNPKFWKLCRSQTRIGQTGNLSFASSRSSHIVDVALAGRKPGILVYVVFSNRGTGTKDITARRANLTTQHYLEIPIIPTTLFSLNNPQMHQRMTVHIQHSPSHMTSPARHAWAPHLFEEAEAAAPAPKPAVLLAQLHHPPLVVLRR